MRALAVIALAFALAGCTDSSDTAGQPPDGGDASTPGTSPQDPEVGGNETGDAQGDVLPWEILDCFFVYAQAQADRDAVEAALPEGFSIPGTGPVTIGFEANDCASGSGVNGTIEPGHYASVWVGVQPPDGLVSEDGAGHFVNFDVMEPDPDRFQWFTERGVNVVDGGCEFGSVIQSQPLAQHSVNCPLFSLTFAGTPLPADAGGAFDQWTPGTDGLTYWRTDWQTAGQYQGPARVTNLAGRYVEWFTEPIQATATFGTWDYTDGQTVWPAPVAS